MSKQNKNIEAIYSLSPMQEGMLFHTLLNKEKEEYIQQVSTTITGNLNIDAFKSAWQKVIDRNSVLRTSFVYKKVKNMLQIAHKKVELPFEVLDWSKKEQFKQENDFNTFLKADRRAGFNLSKPPAMRITLIKFGEKEYKFIWTHHHIILDGWSLPLLLKEVFAFYEAFNAGKELNLPFAQPYKNYISWLKNKNINDAKVFWEKYLKGFSTPIDINLSKDEQIKTGTENKTVTDLFSDVETRQIKKVAQENKITLNSILQVAWANLLHKYTGEEDIVFGATFSGRPTDLNNAESIIGLFINTLPIRSVITENKTILEQLVEFHEQQGNIREYEFTPLVEIQKWSDVDTKTNLFNNIFVFENYPVDESINNPALSLKISDVNFVEKTNFPITLLVAPGKTISLKIYFDQNKFDEIKIKRMVNHLKNITNFVVNNLNKKVNEIEYISNDEIDKVIAKFNQTDKTTDLTLPVHQIISKAAEKNPKSTALIFEDKKITYNELEEHTNRLANFLIKKGVASNNLVGIYLDRSFEMLYGLLAILKAGGAYLPLNPTNPLERVKYQVKDSNAKLILTDSKNKNKLEGINAEILVLDELETQLKNEIAEVLNTAIDLQNTMYCIYTSGSTGSPKGTLVPHKGVVNRLLWMKEQYNISNQDTFLQKTPYDFDVSVWELFLALMSGATLVIAKPEGHKDSNYIKNLIKEQNITIIHFVPAMLSIFLYESNLADDCKSLKRVICSGEALTYELQKKFFEIMPTSELHNLYGPTEASIDVSYWECMRESSLNKVPIGKPIWNTQLYILDKKLNPVPKGVPGELYIGGISLAHGYLNKTMLTAEKFIPDLYNKVPGSRMYKTGDLVRMLENDSIEYITRIDNQVKIRGLRIELGEIETKLIEHKDIKEAVVGIRENGTGEKMIVGYIVLQEKVEPNVSELKQYLRDRIPDYMVPDNFIILDKLPVNPNGKIDRKKLEAFKIQTTSKTVSSNISKTPSEELLISLCQEILQADGISTHDNFFDIGGHSLKAAQLVARVRSAFNIELPIKLVFETNTISELAAAIDKIKKQNNEFVIPPLKKKEINAEPELSFPQKRLWFLDQLEPLKNTYNISAAIKLSGTVNYSALEKSINAIIERHEVLRTSFINKDGKPYIKTNEVKKYKLDLIDISNNKNGTEEAEAKKIVEDAGKTIFNLGKGPLYKIQLVKLSNTEHVFIVVMHHIISDGWSINVMINELTMHYEKYSTGREQELPKLEIQYSDYASWMNNWLKGDLLENKLKYWKEKLKGIPEVLELPFDYVRPPIQTFNGSTVNFKIDTEAAEKLTALNKKEGLTNFMSLLTVFQILLSKYSRQDDIVIGSPIANRTHYLTEPLIGFFVNTLIIRTQHNITNTIIETLKQTRKVTLEAFSNNDVPFEQIVDAVQPERSMSHSPIFQVAFVYQNASNDSFNLRGLDIENYKLENTTSKYDITLYITESKGEFYCSLEYNIDLFKEETIKRIANHFNRILEQTVNNPKLKLSNITLLPESEYIELVNNLNKTNKEFEHKKCIHTIFEDIVIKQPEATALTYSELDSNTLFTNELSYMELNRKANKLANYLIRMGVDNESLIAVSTARSLDLIITILAILKTGGAFLPIDPTYPEERIKYMLEDSGVSVIVTQSLYTSIFTGFNGEIVQIDSDNDKLEKENDQNLDRNIFPENLAYIIYTSGTTGKPKGTLLQHKGVVNLANVQKDAFNIVKQSKIFQFSSLSFDAFIWETVMALLNGASLNLASQEIITSGEYLVKAFIGLGITTVTLPPSVLSIIPTEYAKQESLNKLKTIIVAGEKCSGELASKWAKNRNFINAYGPTETTVCASMYFYKPGTQENPPIGKAINNFQLFILDRNLNPVPVGVPGELYISGIGLSRGYHNKPNLTAEKFIPNPFTNESGARMYKTGDLVKYLSNGDIQFIGRVDSQVKLRGFRIEIGEIESVISQYTSVNEVIVVVREDKPGIKQLVAYFTTANNNKLDIAQLRAFVRTKLPEYMVPVSYVTLDEFPLTPNKKVDYKALPKPSIADKIKITKFVEPRNKIERIIAEIGKELLGIEQMGVYDNFFDLGGHSLLATQFVSKLKIEFNKDIPLRMLFENPSIDELGKIIMELSEISDEDKIEKQDRGNADLNELIAEIQGLSDEEVLKMINDDKIQKGK